MTPVRTMVMTLLVDVLFMLNRSSVSEQMRQARPADRHFGLLPAAMRTLVNIESRKTALTSMMMATGCVRRGRARRANPV